MRLIKKMPFNAALTFIVFQWASVAVSADLAAITQNPDESFITELGGRVGCDEAARWVASPESGSADLTRTLEIMRSQAKARTGRGDRARSWNALIKSHLFNAGSISERCKKSVSKRSMSDGLSELASRAPEGLTIIALGGFGSHLAPEGALTTSLQEWKNLRGDLFSSDRVRYVRVECSFSYSSDESFCAQDMLKSIERFDAESPAPGKHKFLLWGYSKGGTSAIEMLRSSSWLRSRTLAVATVGSPLRGSMVLDQLVPGMDAFAGRDSRSSAAIGVDSVLKVLRLWVGEDPTLITEVMSSFDKFREGAGSLTSTRREDYLGRNLTAGAFSRPDGTSIPVFQIAGIVDPSRLNGVSKLTVRDGKIVPVEKSSDRTHTAELAALISAGNHPLSDTCVAVEDALLPVAAARTAGLDPRFLTLLRADHLSLRLHRLGTEQKYGFPDHAVADSALALIAKGVAP